MCVVLAVTFLHNHAGHALDALGSVVLIVGFSGHVLQILHVRANEHVPQLHEITVCRVLHCKPQCADKTIYYYFKFKNLPLLNHCCLQANMGIKYCHSSFFCMYLNTKYVQPLKAFPQIKL